MSGWMVRERHSMKRIVFHRAHVAFDYSWRRRKQSVGGGRQADSSVTQSHNYGVDYLWIYSQYTALYVRMHCWILLFPISRWVPRSPSSGLSILSALTDPLCITCVLLCLVLCLCFSRSFSNNEQSKQLRSGRYVHNSCKTHLAVSALSDCDNTSASDAKYVHR